MKLIIKQVFEIDTEDMSIEDVLRKTITDLITDDMEVKVLKTDQKEVLHKRFKVIANAVHRHYFNDEFTFDLDGENFYFSYDLNHNEIVLNSCCLEYITSVAYFKDVESAMAAKDLMGDKDFDDLFGVEVI